VGNKALGGTFESEIAKKLTKLLRESGHITEKEEFYRVIGSGKNAHIRENAPIEVLNSMVGDIYGPTKFPFVIECKRRKQNPGFHKMVLNKDKKLEIYSWMDQVLADAEKVNKIPLLFMKFLPNMGTYVAIDHVTWKLWAPVIYNESLPNFVYVNHPTIYSKEDPQAKGRWVIMSWEYFAEIVNSDYDGWLRNKLND